MGKYSQTIQHDYMRFKATFEPARGGVVAGNFSRGGHKISIEPYDPELAREVSNVFTNIDTAVSKGIFNLGHLFEIVEPAAKAANSVPAFLNALGHGIRLKYDVDVERAIDLTVRDATTVNVGKKGRSAVLEVRFENGEDVELSVAGRTVGIRMKPDQTLFSSKLSSIVLGLAAATEASEMPELISRIKEAAENASDIEGWIENIRSGPRAALVSGGPRP